MVRQICHRVAVMYLEEIGPRAAIFQSPRHPYTRHLIAVVPDPARRSLRRDVSNDEIRSPIRNSDYVPPVRANQEVSPGHFVQEISPEWESP
ncbi:MAG: hypothetical protein AB7D00_13935 [Rhodospirillaceae bacterium]